MGPVRTSLPAALRTGFAFCFAGAFPASGWDLRTELPETGLRVDAAFFLPVEDFFVLAATVCLRLSVLLVFDFFLLIFFPDGFLVADFFAAAFFLLDFVLLTFFLAVFFAVGFLRATALFFDDFFVAVFFLFALAFFLVTFAFLPVVFFRPTAFFGTAFLRAVPAFLRFVLAFFFAGIVDSCRSEKNAGLYIGYADMEEQNYGFSGDFGGCFGRRQRPRCMAEFCAKELSVADAAGVTF
jgi:hypothetical protein